MLDNRNRNINRNRKYRCKESIFDFIVGNYYEINELYPYVVEMRIIVNNQYNYYCFELENEFEILPIFIRYFYSENEERKQKLLKIEKS